MRHLRLRQVLTSQGFTGKEYREAIAFEKRNWKEDDMSLPTVGQVRKMHETLGTWDRNTKWERINWGKDIWNNLFVSLEGRNYKNIKPKANYKTYKKVQSYMEKRARWKEQERRTIKFFESMGV